MFAIIDFSPMWETMEQKGVTQYKLLKSGIDNKTLGLVLKIEQNCATSTR